MIENSAPSATPVVRRAPDCPTCSDTGYLREDLPVGHPRFGKLIPCPVCTAPRLARVLQDQVLPAAGLLPHERAISIASLMERGAGSREMIIEVRRMAETPYGLLTVWGGSGNGKTLALQALVNTWLARPASAVYLRLADLLEYLRAGYQEGERIDTTARYGRLTNVELLAIDEFDKARITDWGREWLFTLMDDRYRLARERSSVQCHTVLAMNDDPETLPVYLVSRLRWGLYEPDGFRIVRNTDPDARPSGL